MPSDTTLTVAEAGPAQLRSGLADAGIALPDGPWRRLGGGRTNRLWKIGDDDQAVVVKSYLPEAESPLFPNRPNAEADALRAFGESGLSPRLCATGQIGGSVCLIYEFVPGTIWSSETAGVGVLLGRLHGMTPLLGMRTDRGGSARLQEEIRKILSGCPTDAAQQLLALIPSMDIPPIDHPTTLHGDPVPGNIIRNGAKLTLIDWQCPRLGDPADDLALFLSPAMQHLYRGSPLTEAEQLSFLDAYPDTFIVRRFRALKPLFHLRMAAHCLWKASRGDTEYAKALPLERDRV